MYISTMAPLSIPRQDLWLKDLVLVSEMVHTTEDVVNLWKKDRNIWRLINVTWVSSLGCDLLD